MANRIQEWRNKRGMSQIALAEAAGTTAPQINKLENGERKLTQEWLERLAPPLEVLPSDLLPENFSRPYLSPAEQRILDMYRSLDDTEQVRWFKAFRAYSDPIAPGDVQLTG